MKLIAISLAILLAGCASVPHESAPTNPMDARSAQALALAKIGESATDGETKRLALVMVAMLGTRDTQSAPIPLAPRSVGEAVLTFLDRSTERLFSIVPAYLSYRGQVRSSQTTETVAAINRDVSLNQSNNFLALGAAGINGASSVGTAWANRPNQIVPPTTQVTVSGNSGSVNLGAGTQTNSSNNPSNPSPVVCTTTAGVTTCSR